MLRVRVLGGYTVERDGVTVALPAGAARVLALLALRPGPHDREALAARLWPDSPPAAARASLRTAVWALRKALGEEALAASRSTVGLAPGTVRVDAAEAKALAAAGDLAGAAEMYRGDLLPQYDEDWASAAAAEYRREHAALLDRLAAEAETSGDLAAAIGWAHRRAELDPLDEAVQVALLQRFAAAGARAAGLASARSYADRLHSELGFAPGPAFRAASAELSGPPAGTGARGGVAARPLRPLFGRSAELAVVMAAWSAARRGQGRLVLVTGEGGIGKTRLVAEVARRAAGAGACVAVGAGVDIGGGTPLAVWHELAGTLVAAVPAPPPDAGWPAELGRLGPDLAAALGRREPPPPVAAPELERLRIFDAVLRLVEWAAADRPVLVVAEDVHRADRASLALCAHVARRLTGLPVLFLLTRRDRPARPEVDALLADASSRGVDAEELELGPLSDGELAAVARSVAPLADDDLDRVVAVAEGSPLLVVEATRTLAGGRGTLPAGLRATVRAALGSVPPTARVLAEAVAVAGRALTPAEVAGLGLAGAAGTADVEAQAMDTGLLQRDGAGLGFRHALLAEAARADLDHSPRRHEQVAAAVESAAKATGTTGRVAAEVAGHLRAAGRDELAGPWWRRAAAYARGLGALPDAAEFWAEAVQCEPADPAPRLELAEVHAWLGRRADFESAWAAALPLVAESDRAAAWCRRGGVLRSVLCHPSAALAAYRTALELMPVSSPAALRAEAVLGFAQVAAVTGDPEVGARLADAVRIVGEPDPAMAVDVLTVRLLHLVGLGRFAELGPLVEETAEAIRLAHRPDQAFAGLVSAACGLAAGGDLVGALHAADLALELTADVEVLTLPCLAARAHLLARLGRHPEALVAVTAQLALAERLDSPAFAALACNDAGLVALAAGRYAEAADLLRAALAGSAPVSRPASRLARAEALAQDRRPDEAAAELRAAVLEPVGPADQPATLVPRVARVEGLIARARGDAAEATRRFTEAAEAWERMRRPRPGEELMASLVDLGRPPVVGLAEPAWELARLAGELAAVKEGSCRASS